MTEKDIAQASYDEADRVTEAYRIQYRKRRHSTSYPDEVTKAKAVEEALAQMEAAERAEFAAWERLNHLRQMVIKRPWTAVV